MIDVHTHILPGIDDGSRSVQETEAMCKAASSAGIRFIVASSHYNPRYHHPERIEAAFRRAVPIARRHGIHLRKGCEFNIRMASAVPDILPFCFQVWKDGTKFLLLELDNTTDIQTAMFFINDLVKEHVTPILVHPERYLFVQKDVQSLRELTVYGTLIQADVGALQLPLWHPERRTIGQMMRQHLVDCFASDAHSVQAYQRLGQLLQKKHISLPMENFFA